jgi:hypothetical protein
LASEPPNGLEWTDMIEVIDLFKTKEKELFGEVQWKNQEKSYILSDIIRIHCPIAVSTIGITFLFLHYSLIVLSI